MSVFSEWLTKYPTSKIAMEYIDFGGKGFFEGQHGHFAMYLYVGDIWAALGHADVENTQMLHDLLFPKYLENMCADCERVDPEDVDPSEWCNEGYQ